ncbi:hypothetical protein EV421DRAFT_318163 [Armillaria borealis]|uniref:Uncharacterized protein n=1 Tax=Armillaria borealis TaxID=47425 RepID=A0AA39JMD0_9AGAR|nr:hypothetical protein EV421DRAFT_318163 [Armillaria borealis]
MTANFQATAGELSLVTRIFAQADPKKTGFLSGEVAVRVFGGAKLPPTVLGEIWNIADDENRGSLNSKGVAVAIRLIGWAQKGEKVTPALVNQAGPLPTIEGVSGISTHNTGMSIPRSPPPTSGLPPFTAQDKAKFQNMFLKSGPTNGLLSGEKARDILIKSKLPNDKLGQIWNLADTHNRGSLDATDFAIAMYLVQGAMSGQITAMPSVLPPALYQQASGSPAAQSAIRAQTTGTSGSFSPINSNFSQRAVQSQYTGQNQLPLQPDVTGGFPARRGPPVPPHLPARPSPSQVGSGAFGRTSANTHWDITPAEKTDSDKFFDNLDSQRRGYIEGDVAVPFMLESQLGEEDLARVWDLADINNDGRLTRDGFAVALYLIKKKLAGIDVPVTLPPTLVPPSMRKSNGSAFSPAPSPPPPAPEPAIDLLWDDIPAQPVPAAAPSRAFSIPLQPTGSQVSASGSSFNSPPQAQPAAQDPFRSSPFGLGSAAAKDLLSDDDDVQAAPSRLHDQSAEIGNTQNQLNSTNRSLETAKTERASVEQTLANQAAQLSALQTQLSSAKAAYESETKQLSTLRDRLNTQTAEIQKTRETLISAESDLSAVRVEKAEIEGAFMRDKEEARELHRKMLEFSQQADALKAETEKSKKEAKQQKGLLAIAKKQLSTKEADRAKAEKELQEANAELVAVNKEKAETQMQIAELDATPIVAPAPARALSSDSLAFAASHALPVTPDPTSPAVSTKSNNPFDRLALSSGHSTPRSESPFMPFATTSLPSPPTGVTGSNVAESGDPFGFSQAFESLDASPEPAVLEAPKAPIEELEVSTPRVPAAELGVSTALSTSEAPTSPGSASEPEVFTTPPTTSAGLPESANGKQSTLEVTSSKFPLIEEPVTVSPAPENDTPPEPLRKSEDQTDLGTPLKEIDVEESDSDSEEDEVPLALLAKRMSESPTTIAVPPPPERNGPAPPPASSFDDIFGVASSPSPAAPTISTAEADVFGVPIKHSPSPFDTSDVFTSSSAEKPQNGRVVSGVNAFDEAMGKLPSTGPSPTQFSFDSAFDDNFDFGASSEPAFPPAPKAVNGGTTSPLPVPKDDGFNSLFTTPTIVTTNGNHTSAPAPDRVPTPTPTATSAATSPESTTEPSGPSFDDVFSGFNPSPSLNLDTTLTAIPAKAPESPKMLPTTTSPPRSLSSPQGNRPISPPLRERSPPPRVNSPKPRPSTSSSSKEGHELKPPAPRHSKLSIRLPFGKKKKQEAMAPPPSQFLTPPAEEPRSTTPASDDDVEPVKQLTAMGFSRTQAVAALEKYAYDVPRALNSLLGQ